jgi:hypothetical protein
VNCSHDDVRHTAMARWSENGGTIFSTPCLRFP